MDPVPAQKLQVQCAVFSFTIAHRVAANCTGASRACGWGEGGGEVTTPHRFADARAQPIGFILLHV